MRMIRGKATLLVLGLTAGCTLHQQFEDRLDLKAMEALFAESPSDVAVLPVVDRTGSPRAQMLLPTLRRALYLNLIDRCYAPLDLGFVDRILRVEPEGPVPPIDALLGKFEEDAILLVELTGWNERPLAVDRRLRAELFVSLRSTRTKAQLWGGTAKVEVQVGGHGMVGPDEIDARKEEAVRLVAAKVLSCLPKRRTGGGKSPTSGSS